MAEQFGADPGALRSVANVFVREADALKKPIAAFAAASAGVGEAFGVLGACDGATGKYVKLQESTAATLSKLPGVLNNDAEGLRATAKNYADSDETARGHVESVRTGGAR